MDLLFGQLNYAFKIVLLLGMVNSGMLYAGMLCNRCNETLLWNGKANVCVSGSCNKGSKVITEDTLDRYGDGDLLQLLSAEEQQQIFGLPSISVTDSPDNILGKRAVLCAVAEKFKLTPMAFSEAINNLEIMRRSLCCLYSCYGADVVVDEYSNETESFLEFSACLNDFAEARGVKLSAPDLYGQQPGWDDFFVFSKEKMNISEIMHVDSFRGFGHNLKNGKKITVVYTVRKRGYFLLTLEKTGFSGTTRKIVINAFNMKPVKVKPIKLTPILESLWKMTNNRPVVTLHHR